MTAPLQVALGNSNNTTTVTATLSGVTAGDLIPIMLVTNTSGITINSITDSSGDVPAVAIAYTEHASNSASAGAWYVKASVGGTHTITVTFAAAAAAELYIAEYAGNWNLDATAAVAFGTGTTTFASNSITPSANGAQVIEFFGAQGTSTTFSALTGGFTQEGQQNAKAPTSAWADVTQATAAAISGGGTISLTTAHWAAAIMSFVPGTALPTVTSVNGGSAITEGATAVPVVGTNFASGMTGAIKQSINGTVGATVSQTTTFVSSTSATFNLSMEPAGTQLAFSDATYTHVFQATVSGVSGAGSIAGGLAPPSGLIFETLASINGTSAFRITASPDLVIGDQLEAAGNLAGTAPVPTGLQLNSDATWQFSPGNPPTDFYVRAYDSVNFVWGAWALQSTAAALAQNVVYRRYPRRFVAQA